MPGRTLILLFLLTITIPCRADDSVYQKAASSVVRVICTAPDGNEYTGTGVMTVHGILTAGHVIKPGGVVRVVFPELDDNGQVIRDEAHYANSGKLCRVILTSIESDLAMLMPVKTVQTGHIGFGGFPKAGDRVIGIGCGTDPLWRPMSGEVLRVRDGVWQSSAGVEVKARVIDSTMSIVPGDSGCPILDDAGQLVGITIGKMASDKSVAFGVGLVPISRFLMLALNAELLRLQAELSP